jgi:hypothetical protein
MASELPMPDAAAELARKMLQMLEAQRRQGAGAYPLSISRLVELMEPSAPTALVDKAIAKKTFTDRVLVAQKKHSAAPAALVEDLELLAASPTLLEWALDSVCTAANPTCPVSKLKTRVVARLKKPFEEAVKQQVRENRLPLAVGWILVKRTIHLYLRRMPPPPPPRPPALELAEKMVRVLEIQRRHGGAFYPVTLKRLAELIDPEAKPVLILKAAVQEPFRTQAVVARTRHLEAPVALAADLDTMADSPLLLEFLLASSRTAATHAFLIGAWKTKMLSKLWPPFQQAVERRLADGTLPLQVGWLLIKGRKYLFLNKDLNGGRPPQPAAAPAAAVAGELPSAKATENFGTAFEEAFDRLDRQHQSHNRVSMLELRRALPAPRAVFDAGLDALRQARRFTLSAAEGRHSLRPEEQEAGIIEDGTLLLYVSRRNAP